jgi:asparagine N-glycosylation enzyme membrane subunit Stt3
MAARTKQVWLTVRGIGVAMLPKLLCPMWRPLYAGVVSSVGLGFLIGTAYLLPITGAFLVLTLVVLGFRAKQRPGYGPFFLGVIGSAVVLTGKFYLESNPLIYGVWVFWRSHPFGMLGPAVRKQPSVRVARQDTTV